MSIVKQIGCEHPKVRPTVIQLVEELESMNLSAHIEFHYPLGFLYVYFKNKDDLMFYKIAGSYPTKIEYSNGIDSYVTILYKEKNYVD